jgi:hypothetical protein
MNVRRVSWHTRSWLDHSRLVTDSHARETVSYLSALSTVAAVAQR